MIKNIKNEELINILNKLGFEWYDFEDSTDGSGSFSKTIKNKEESYYISFSCFASFTDAWKVKVRNCKNYNRGTLYFNNNEISLEDINSLIRICKINLILE